MRDVAVSGYGWWGRYIVASLAGHHGLRSVRGQTDCTSGPMGGAFSAVARPVAGAMFAIRQSCTVALAKETPYPFIVSHLIALFASFQAVTATSGLGATVTPMAGA